MNFVYRCPISNCPLCCTGAWIFVMTRFHFDGFLLSLARLIFKSDLFITSKAAHAYNSSFMETICTTRDGTMLPRSCPPSTYRTKQFSKMTNKFVYIFLMSKCKTRALNFTWQDKDGRCRSFVSHLVCVFYYSKHHRQSHPPFQNKQRLLSGYLLNQIKI